jgi:putative ABC transport system permease protein
MALTLAILCNALFIIQQRLALSARPTGIDEANIFVLGNLWIGGGDNNDDLASKLATDLAALRALPGVVDAYATNSYPLRGGGWSTGVSLAPDQKHSTAHAADYFVDDHAQAALGVKLLEGHWFTAEDMVDRGPNDEKSPSKTVIVSAPLAKKLFPDSSAVGKQVYIDEGVQTIIGVVQRMQTPWVSDSWGEAFVENSLLEPNRFLSRGYFYVVRTQPGRTDALLAAAQRKLLEITRERVFEKPRTFADVRHSAYQDDRGLAVILAVVSTLLLVITAFGIVGLTSFWVTQRRRQIGIRRALGATRGDIVRYFQTENFLIAAVAAAIGAAVGIGLNLLLVQNFEVARMPWTLPLIGAGLILVLGQGAALWPALRAAAVPPALATRAA